MGFNGIGSVNWVVDGYRKIEVKEEAALQGLLRALERTAMRLR